MTEDITVYDSTVERLESERQTGETRGDVVQRLLNDAGVPTAEDGEVEQMAQGTMTASELLEADKHNQSNTEFLSARYGVDVGEYDDPDELREAVHTERRA